ncbi:hypothetical protein SAMN04489760_14616 [Syntrophus gentianae]|uniref:Uncharacterized protein n=1 Tax=Syntrophus gentianae TaxID=43775 RepID=A0A1H8B4I4_9BACT|nr:hypothetical protein [Syntrophus gentianae]SEM77792.1 hypothetical protein SAMN04489760_14616 [Syntrophus gentianae]
MHRNRLEGREAEIDEIVKMRRAAEVGRLLLGELNGPLAPIFADGYSGKTRAEIKAERASIRQYLRAEVTKFCQRNFSDLRPNDLAKLYEPLYQHKSVYRLALSEFVAQFGRPKKFVLRGAPEHSTICLSPWGLQTEYPEMHLSKDVAISYNEVVTIVNSLKEYKNTSWRKAKTSDVRNTVADLHRREAFFRRMCLLSCFNLVEAYINGIAWEFVKSTDISTLSNKQQKLLTEGQASLLDKLVKVPTIVMSQSTGPLTHDENPLAEFRELIKPFRDSIVHASPFGAAERFGGYDKLSRVYELSFETVQRSVELTFEIIGRIHRFLGSERQLPDWCPPRMEDGTFEIPIG